MSGGLIPTRRAFLESSSLLAVSSALKAQIAPSDELVSASEFETIARGRLDAATFAAIASGRGKPFDRITFRPRMMVNTAKLDLTADLFGQAMFAPILVGPVSRQKRFHPEGELASMRGAAAAKAVMVVADRSDYPLDRIAGENKQGFWYQVYPEPDLNALRARVQSAAAAGCKAVCLTLGVWEGSSEPWDWKAIDRFREGIKIPVILKGIMTPEEAKTAVANGIQGIVVSNYTGSPVTGLTSPIETLPVVAEAVAGKVPILIDGGFERGGDVLKALALGAQAVMVSRPALWGLAAYGADGVQKVMELLQSELARDMAMCGKVNLKSIDRALVKVHHG